MGYDPAPAPTLATRSFGGVVGQAEAPLGRTGGSRGAAAEIPIRSGRLSAAAIEAHPLDRLTATVDDVASDTVTGAIGAMAGIAGLGATLQFHRRQAASLPPRLQRALDSRWWPVVAAAALTAMLALLASRFFVDTEGPAGTG